ncbi:DNA polymerase III, alpha subunit [Raineyella antarctica]|uniref:DNA polymerase III subunit alpha n=1 Tax=Raineyella antarctica TaxID=1577474 RepID=A0A1G6GG41_9ACTN|nr:DNA polymerase III subunit alpha [Raineyella antarctica]SDB80146.1 DNA polymerase III, alpha subunit [Raineyella antarctica]
MEIFGGDDPFIHLRVASGYSLRYGASHPADLVRTAAEHGMDTLALTDRDGLYGAVRFAKACLREGIAPVLGVDLGLDPRELGDGPALGSFARSVLDATHRPGGRAAGSVVRKGPALGGATREVEVPRVVVLATSGAGWATLCRLTSAVHRAAEERTPDSGLPEGQVLLDAATARAHLPGADVVVLVGADSDVGLALAAGDADGAGRALDDWAELVGVHRLAVAATDLLLPGLGVGSGEQAARLVTLAHERRLEAVVTNMVRMSDASLGATVDVLDAARRGVPLARGAVRRNEEDRLKSGKEMLDVLHGLARRAGLGEQGAERLLAATRRLGQRCRLDPGADLGLGQIHLPEFDVLQGEGKGPQAADAELRRRCRAGIATRYGAGFPAVTERLEAELATIAELGFAAYFLTVADIVDMIHERGIRCAARGSGAGSLVNYLLGISGVDPLASGLIMERFLSPLRRALPDIDLDVESARRTEVYRMILERFGTERVACVAMVETYRVRHAIRDVGAALSLPPGEVDVIAKAFPHIRARDARSALRELPELRSSGLGADDLAGLFALVESLDGLPRHIALHPCGVVLSDARLLDRTPVETSSEGFPMSAFDKDDVEDLGFLKLDVLGIRMQSAMAHCLDEIERTTGSRVDIDSFGTTGFSDPATYALIGAGRTLGCFQIESPGQRELVTTFGPQEFNDIVIDISLFRPGPVKSDMVRPFLEVRQGWARPRYPHPSLEPVLAETGGVVVFHEQVIGLISTMTGCTLAQGDEMRRELGSPEGQREVELWFRRRAEEHGYAEDVVDEVWRVLAAFASFGFCKAHAAAFALPTYQSAWLKTHWPAHFLAGILTHDPGMYPKRLLLAEARHCGVGVLGLDVNASAATYRVEQMAAEDERQWGIRIGLDDVQGITAEEVARIIEGRPWTSLTDFWQRAQVTRPVAERLVTAGAFDRLYALARVRTPEQATVLPTRRDLLLSIADLSRADRGHRGSRGVRTDQLALGIDVVATPGTGGLGPDGDILDEDAPDDDGPDRPGRRRVPADLACSRLPDMNMAERVRAELEVLGLDVSRHVVDFYRPLMAALGTVDAVDLLGARNRSEVLVAGVKVATQTPPIRSGKRVIFLSLDDGTGPVDTTFFEDAQGPYASTVFNGWLLLVRGVVRRTGIRGVSVRATGCWDLAALTAVFREQGIAAVHRAMHTLPEGWRSDSYAGVGEVVGAPGDSGDPGRRPGVPDPYEHARSGGMGQRRTLVHASGFRSSPYADVRPAGPGVATPRKLWHSSPGSPGR